MSVYNIEKSDITQLYLINAVFDKQLDQLNGFFDGQLDLLKVNFREYRRGNKKNDDPEKLALQVTQDEEKQSKNTTQYAKDQ